MNLEDLKKINNYYEEILEKQDKVIQKLNDENKHLQDLLDNALKMYDELLERIDKNDN